MKITESFVVTDDLQAGPQLDCPECPFLFFSWAPQEAACSLVW